MTVSQGAVGLKATVSHNAGTPSGAAPPPTPPAFVQQAGSITGAGATASIAIPVAVQTTQGNSVVAIFAVASGRTVTGVIDTKGNAWAIDFNAGGLAPNVVIARAPLAAALGAGDTITATLSGSSTGFSGQALECSNIHAVDQTAAAAFAGTPVTVGPTAATAAAGLAITGASSSLNANTWTPPAGWTEVPLAGKGDGAWQTTIQGATPSATWGAVGASNMDAAIVAYR